jgi:hypothetical protein
MGLKRTLLLALIGSVMVKAQDGDESRDVVLGQDEVVEVSQEKELVPIQCLRQTEFKGTYVGTPFSDADTISKEVTKPMRMYAV